MTAMSPFVCPRVRNLSQRYLIAVMLISLLPLNLLAADDWPQWLGPNRASTWNAEGTISEFDANGPVVKWRIPISGGYAGPAVVDQRLFVMDYVRHEGDPSPNPDQRNELKGTERIHCIDAQTGDTIWTHKYNCPYKISYPAGPRVTPTVDEDVVYSLGAEGDLICLNTRNGKLVWSRNFAKDYRAETPLWGYCGHPLVDGDKLICIVCGEGSLVVAFDKQTGKELWRSLDAKTQGYSAPVIYNVGRTRQLMIWHPEGLVSLDPETGKVYWSEPLTPNYGMSIAVPRRSGDLIFVGGIVNQSMMLRLHKTRPKATLLWEGAKDVGIDPVHSTPYVEDGFMYGVTREGKLTAVRMDTGQVLWSNFDLMPDNRRAQSGTVFLVKNRDKFFLCNDSGELIIARMTPHAYREMGRIKLLEPTGDAFGRKVVWSHPAFANGCIFARNDKELICVSLSNADN